MASTSQTPSVSLPLRSVKVEPQDPFPPSQPAEGEPSSFSSLVKSIGELNGLSSSLSTFTQKWNDLETHLHSIHNSIQHHLQTPNNNNHPPPPQIENSQKPPETERICDTGRNLRKCVLRHLKDNTDTDEIRDEVSEILNRAPNPARLVLDCIGRFYLQGSKAYSKEPHLIPVRKACIFVLESFLLCSFSSQDIDPSVKEEAAAVATAWRTRLIREGGIANACTEDALGLLLFVASFGIPFDFGRLDLLELIRLSDLEKKDDKKADALRLSPLLNGRVQDMIQEMVNDGMHVAAVGLSCAFRLQGKLSPFSLLSSFIHETNQTTKKMRREGQGSHLALKKANEMQLAALKSVIKCMEDHQLDLAELSSWKINEKIANLEKDISNSDHKEKKDISNAVHKENAASKRKAEPFSSEELKTQEAKHHRPTSTQRHPPPMVIASQEKSLHDGLAPNSLPPDGGFPAFFSGFSGALAGSVTVPSGKYLGALAGSGGVLVAGAGPSSAASGVGFSIGNGGVGSFPGINRNWHGGDGALNDYPGGQHSLLAVQQGFRVPPMAANGLLSQRGAGADLYQFADTVSESEAQDSSRLGTATSAFYRQPYF
ncbi:protein FRIGIDA-like [Tasmannia lanceolata]|uniref:protein FRIGIDA-like n=1 Tax=Tasmannia lanceolata TaxID=3420 RepID=UPI004063ED34